MPKGNKRVARSSVIGPVKKAEDPTIGPLSSSNIGGPSEAGADFSLREPSKNRGSKKQRWIAVYNEALAGECRNSGNPTECARAEANAAVGEMDTKVEPVATKSIYNAPFFRIKGGAGSGHFQHEGRPGEKGGSKPGKGGGGRGPTGVSGSKGIGKFTEIKSNSQAKSSVSSVLKGFGISHGDMKSRYISSNDPETGGVHSVHVKDIDWQAWLKAGPKKVTGKFPMGIMFNPYFVNVPEGTKIMGLGGSQVEDSLPSPEERWEAVERGGAGSGHHDHAGRPGEVGGSAPSNGKGGPSQSDRKAARKAAEKYHKAGRGYRAQQALDREAKNIGLREDDPEYQRADPLGEDMKETHQAEKPFIDEPYTASPEEKRLDGMRRHKFLTKAIENKLPDLYSQENNPDPTVLAKWFHPYSTMIWYATEYDPKTAMFFGYVDTGDYNSELGYFSRKEMAETLVKGLPIERDKYFTPVKLSRITSPDDTESDRGSDKAEQEYSPFRSKSTTVKEEENMEFTDYPPEYVERRFFNTEKRKEMAGRGTAMSDGSFPISNCEDVQNAVSSLGRTDKPRAEVVRHIRARAKSIGCKMTPALKRRMVFWDDYLVRKSRRDEANAVDYQLIERHGDTPIHRPSRVDVMAWRSMPDESKTVRAEATRRIIHRNYAQEVEDAQTRGWKAHINHYEPDEHYFTKMVDTDAGNVMVRALLLRSTDSVDWKLHVVSEFASGSLASMLPDGLVRHNKKAMLEIPVLRGGPGSGHHGHAGRAGEVGGSMPAGDSGFAGRKTTSPNPQTQKIHDRKVKESNEVYDLLDELGMIEDADRIKPEPEKRKQLAERLPDMSINQIAREIRKDWGSKVNYAAKPYLDAMGSLESINDNYYADTGISVVSYFLSNAGQWRGDTARATKAELKRRLKGGA